MKYHSSRSPVQDRVDTSRSYFLKKTAPVKVISYHMNNGLLTNGSLKQAKSDISRESAQRDYLNRSTTSNDFFHNTSNQKTSQGTIKQLSRMLSSTTSSKLMLTTKNFIKDPLDKEFRIVRKSSNDDASGAETSKRPKVFERLSSLPYLQSACSDTSVSNRQLDIKSKFISEFKLKEKFEAATSKIKETEVKPRVNSHLKKAAKEFIKAKKVSQFENEVQSFNFSSQPSVDHEGKTNTKVKREGLRFLENLDIARDPLASPKLTKHVSLMAGTQRSPFRDPSKILQIPLDSPTLNIPASMEFLPSPAINQTVSLPAYFKSQKVNETKGHAFHRGNNKVLLRRRDFPNIPELIKENKDLRWLKHIMNMNRTLICDFNSQRCIIRDQLLILQDKLEHAKMMLRALDLTDFVGYSY